MSDDFTSMPRKRIGAGIVAGDDCLRVLLVEPTYKTNWEVPGGLVELGEPPRHLPHDGLMLLYAAGPIDTSQIILPPEELKSWLWCDTKMMQERVHEFMFGRLEAALEAIFKGTVAELENGYAASSGVR